MVFVFVFQSISFDIGMRVEIAKFQEEVIQVKEFLLKSQIIVVEGFYNQNSSSQSIRKWWRCIGGFQRFHEILLQLEATVVFPPFTTLRDFYYINSCEKALQSRAPKSSFRVLQLESWNDTATGIHGFVDFEVRRRNSFSEIEVYNITMEFDDNGATAMDIYVNSQPAKDSKIVLVTPIFNQTEQFWSMMATIEYMAQIEDNFGCYFIDFEDDLLDIEEEVKNLTWVKKIDFQVLKFDLPFRKAPTFQAAIDRLHEDDIALVMDVDITFDWTILSTIRRYVVKNKRFYSPIVNNSLIDIGREDTIGADNYNGWAVDWTGIIAIYKSDIDRFGGFDTNTFSSPHSLEDTDFFFAAKSSKLQVVRRKDESLIQTALAKNEGELQEREFDIFCPS